MNTETNKPLSIMNHFTIGSFTTGNFQPPQGEVFKLTLTNLDAGTEHRDEGKEPLFGAHIREAIAIVKDWKKRP